MKSLKEIFESLSEGREYTDAYALGRDHGLSGGPRKAPWPKGYPYDLHHKAYNMGYKEWRQKSAKAQSKGIEEAAIPSVIEQKFPDTADGAVAMLTSTADKRWMAKLDIPTCKIHPDPSVEGVWAIDSYAIGERVIIYLAGYRKPFGNKREINDFESGYFTDKMVWDALRTNTVSKKQMLKWVKAGNLSLEKYKELVEKYNYHYGLDESYDADDDYGPDADENDEWNYQQRQHRNKLLDPRDPDYDERLERDFNDVDESTGISTAWKVTYWIEEKSYDDRPSRDYESTIIVHASSAEEAEAKAQARRKYERAYGFTAAPATQRDIDQDNLDEDAESVTDFLNRGGSIKRATMAKPRKAERWVGSAHIGGKGEAKSGSAGKLTGRQANVNTGGKPVVMADKFSEGLNNESIDPITDIKRLSGLK